MKKKTAKNPIVSIIVPTLNEEKFIDRTLRFLLNQTVPRESYEIIVSDSSSTDKTVSVAKRFADRVTVCERKGAGFGRNQGAQIAKGKYLAFVDADTLVAPTYVEGVMKGLDQFVACSGPLSSYDAKDAKSQMFYTWWDQQVRLSTLMQKPLLPGFNIAVRKKNFDEVGGFISRNALHEDHDFSLKVAKTGKVGWMWEMMVYTSSRRVKTLGVRPQIKISLDYFFFNKFHPWEEYRRDFSRDNEKANHSK